MKLSYALLATVFVVSVGGATLLEAKCDKKQTTRTGRCNPKDCGSCEKSKRCNCGDCDCGDNCDC